MNERHGNDQGAESQAGQGIRMGKTGKPIQPGTRGTKPAARDVKAFDDLKGKSLSQRRRLAHQKARRP